MAQWMFLKCFGVPVLDNVFVLYHFFLRKPKISWYCGGGGGGSGEQKVSSGGVIRTEMARTTTTHTYDNMGTYGNG